MRNKRSEAVARGNRTRMSRNWFKKAFGERTEEVVRLISQGLSTKEVAKRTNLKDTSIATFKGNLTRGYYVPFAYVTGEGEVTGTCNY